MVDHNVSHGQDHIPLEHARVQVDGLSALFGGKHTVKREKRLEDNEGSAETEAHAHSAPLLPTFYRNAPCGNLAVPGAAQQRVEHVF